MEKLVYIVIVENLVIAGVLIILFLFMVYEHVVDRIDLLNERMNEGRKNEIDYSFKAY